MDTPVFNPGFLYVRDDQMDEQQSLGVFYDAPGWRHEDFYAFLLMQRVFGNFNQFFNHECLIDLPFQNNMMHEFVRTIPDLERYDAIFSPYSDCGIFGHYFFGSSKYAQHMSYLGGHIGEMMSEYLTDVEVTRAKNKMYNELLSVQAASDHMQ